VSAASSQDAVSDRLCAHVDEYADAAASRWLRSCLDVVAEDFELNRFLGVYAAAGRRFRGRIARVDEGLARAAGEIGVDAISQWTLDRCARVVLLRAALDATAPAAHVEIVAEAYRTGDSAEREALLGALLLLRQPERFDTTAIDACRNNVATVFAALACDNAYPSRYFSDAAFNQMVLKTVFIELPIARVVGLAGRANAELARMAENYASERRAAGRLVSADVDLLLSLGEREKLG
jgi:hypothetical protein